MLHFPTYVKNIAGIGLILALSACGSVYDTPNQQVQVITPGAENAKCILESPYARYVAYPPETVFMRRDRDALKVTCDAPGNRSKTTIVYPSMNGRAVTGDIATAGVGAVYDHFSGALYEYPNPISVDFRYTQASDQAMPKYHAYDTVSPFDQKAEDFRDSSPNFPEDVNSPRPPATLRDDMPDAPADDSEN